MQGKFAFTDKKEILLIQNNIYSLAAFAPLHSRWNDLVKIDEFKNLAIVQSAFLRVLFAIVAFIIFPVICTLSAPTYLLDGKKLSGFNKTQLFTINSFQEIAPSNEQPVAPSGPLQAREGLDNLGNSCYINACIQAIVGFTPLFTLFLASKANSSLKDSLLKLLEALKNFKSGQSKVKPLLEDFYKELMDKASGWNVTDRMGVCRMNDSTDLLFFLANRCEVSFTDISKISTTTTFLQDGQQTKVMKGEPEVFFRIVLDGKKSIQEYIHSKMRDSESELSLTLCETDSIAGGVEIDEKDLFLYFLNSKIHGGEFIKELQDTPPYRFKKGSSLHKELLDVLQRDYTTLKAVYYSNPPQGYKVYIGAKREQSFLSADSTAIIVTIENPSKTFVPDLEITIEGNTFKLQGVIRRPRGCHYTFFENMHGELGVTYDDDKVTREVNMSEARCLFYTKIDATVDL